MTSTNFKKTKTGRIKYFVIIAPIIIATTTFLYFSNMPAWLVIERIDSNTDRLEINLEEDVITDNPKLKQAIAMADSSHEKTPNIPISDVVMLTNTEGHNLLYYFKKDTFMKEVSGNQHEFIIQKDGNSYRLVIYFSYSTPLLA
jgi:hypothetical protein